MADQIITAGGQPTVEPITYKCEFKVESAERAGGDWQANIGGLSEEMRVVFNGEATPELYKALIEAMGRVGSNE